MTGVDQLESAARRAITLSLLTRFARHGYDSDDVRGEAVAIALRYLSEAVDDADRERRLAHLSMRVRFDLLTLVRRLEGARLKEPPSIVFFTNSTIERLRNEDEDYFHPDRRSGDRDE